MGHPRQILVRVHALAFLYAPVTLAVVLIRISARPCTNKGSFHISILAQNFDPADLVDTTKFVEFVRKYTGLGEKLVFKEIVSLNYWK